VALKSRSDGEHSEIGAPLQFAADEVAAADEGAVPQGEEEDAVSLLDDLPYTSYVGPLTFKQICLGGPALTAGITAIRGVDEPDNVVWGSPAEVDTR
jgi:hypothetical protein